MILRGQGEIADAPLKSSSDFSALIASLRSAGAEKFDPVGLHYIDTLARRATSHEGSVRRLLDARLAQAVTAFEKRFERARLDAREVIAQCIQRFPQASDDLQQLFDAADLQGVRQHAANLQNSAQRASLGALVRQLERQSHEHPAEHATQAFPEKGSAMSGMTAAPRPELKTIRNFRNTWSKLSVEKQVTQALEHAPANAGPINSHMLVLRSLALMRDVSPDYLNRFMTYADTLLCLDQGEKEKAIIPKKRPASKTPKK